MQVPSQGIGSIWVKTNRCRGISAGTLKIWGSPRRLRGGREAIRAGSVISDYRINILDSIMDMMEKYARNLEENVEERAQELMEEKRKTDRLLYRLLPA